MTCQIENFGSRGIEKDWCLIDGCSDGYDRANSDAIRRKVEVFKGRFINAGKTVTTAAFGTGFGGYIVGHLAGLYAYYQFAPTTPFQQYVYANAIHELAVSILNTTVCGVSVSSLATVAVAVLAGVIVTKLGITIYNLCVDKEWKINLSLIRTIQSVFIMS